MNVWLVIIGMGAITVALRLSLIVFLRELTLPPLVRRALNYVPVAVLSAIIVPEVLLPGGALDVSVGNARLPAALVAVVVASRTRNVLWTIAAGMAVVWGLGLWG